MNIMNQITLRHLKENKRRTLVTIIGVIISVAMISAVTTLGSSFLDLMVRQSISTNGDWHLKYISVDGEQIEAIENDENTKNVILASDGYAELEGSKNLYKPYLHFQNYNAEGLESFPIDITKGRLPKNEQEVVISEAIKRNAKVDYAIGDQITVDIGDRWDESETRKLTQNEGLLRDGDEPVQEKLNIFDTKTVTIVGTMTRPDWEPSWAPGYTVVGYVDETALTSTDQVDALVSLNKVNGSIYTDAKTFVTQHNIENVQYNTDLLRYYGVTEDDNLRTTLFGLAGIILAVIVLGSVALIYNAFAISVSERARHLGMLSSVGATKKQKRNSVFFEGLVIGGISIPIGLLAGIAGIAVTFLFINSFLQGALNVNEKLEVVVTPYSILFAILISAMTILISCYLPARQASKISAIDAIRQTQDIRLSSKKVKTSKLVRKLFGLEAEIGLKNTKRNRKRYLATVFSLVVSIILFLIVGYFTDSIKQSLEMTQNEYKYDVMVNGSDLDKADFLRYRALDDVSGGTYVEEAAVQIPVEEQDLPKGLKDQINQDSSLLVDGKYVYYASLIQLDKDSFDAYVKEIGANRADFENSEVPTAVLIDETTYQEVGTGNFVTSKTIESNVGDTLEFYSNGSESGEDTGGSIGASLGEIQIGATTNEIPSGVTISSLGAVSLIFPEGTFTEGEVFEQYAQSSSIIALNTSNPDATQELIEADQDMNLYVFNVSKTREQQEQSLMLLSIFAYGFIILISLISVANIFNTISTSVSLRRREFAMLRSMGMTPKGFDKMVSYESIFYGVKALIYGLPLSVLIMYAIYRTQSVTFRSSFTLPWTSIGFVVVLIFLIVGSAMLYSISKIKKDNIIESLKQESS